MKSIGLHVVVSLLVCFVAHAACAQSDEDVVESLQLEMVELAYEASEQDRQRLLEAKVAPKSIDDILFSTYNDYAYCVADTAQATAVEEQVPVEYVVDVLKKNMCTLGNWRSEFGFDSVTLYKRVMLCSAAAGKRLRVAE